jgi:glycerate-2-kinase
MVLPAYRITLEEKQQVTRALLDSGAPIAVINRVRKAMSAIKGGRLAKAAAPLPVTTYVISDVPGDDPAMVGSGPSLPDDSDPNDALVEMAAWGVNVSFDLGCLIGSNHPPGIKPGPVHVLATARGALEAAAARAIALGLTPVILGDAIEGEAREVGTAMAGIALSVARHGSPARPPCVLLSGGETTVTVRPRTDGKRGRGGRNAEFLLGLLRATDGHPGIAALACDTDGIDGTEDNAGAWFDDTTAAEARAKGLDSLAHLRGNDAWSFFHALDRLVVTGPTLTNVNDFRAVLVR